MARTLIIAEVGVNHNGDLKLAKKHCDAAKKTGCDVVKFQTFNTESLMRIDAELADYQKTNVPDAQSQYELIKALELSYAEFRELKKYCESIELGFMSTPDEELSLRFLNELNLSTIKIGSAEITTIPYLRKVAQCHKDVILSTGMATLNEVKLAANTLLENGLRKEQLTILQCTSCYPAPIAEVNLLAMVKMGEELGLKYGYSDHTIGISIPLAAAALGASVIEKHLTLDKSLPGPDHIVSLNLEEFAQMVVGIREIEKALGNGIKEPTASEISTRRIVRKSIVAKTTINIGEIFSENNITTKRPGTGLSPVKWDQLIGKKATKSYMADSFIEEDL